MNVVGVEQDTRPISHPRGDRLTFVALHFLVEEVQRRAPEERGQEEKQDGRSDPEALFVVVDPEHGDENDQGERGEATG